MLIINEKEEFIPDDGTADQATELVRLVRRPGFSKEVARIQGIIS